MSPLDPARHTMVDVLDLVQLAGDAFVAVALTAVNALQPAAPRRRPGPALVAVP